MVLIRSLVSDSQSTTSNHAVEACHIARDLEDRDLIRKALNLEPYTKVLPDDSVIGQEQSIPDKIFLRDKKVSHLHDPVPVLRGSPKDLRLQCPYWGIFRQDLDRGLWNQNRIRFRLPKYLPFWKQIGTPFYERGEGDCFPFLP